MAMVEKGRVTDSPSSRIHSDWSSKLCPCLLRLLAAIRVGREKAQETQGMWLESHARFPLLSPVGRFETGGNGGNGDYSDRSSGAAPSQSKRLSAGLALASRSVSEPLREGATTDGHKWTRISVTWCSRGRPPRTMRFPSRSEAVRKSGDFTEDFLRWRR
jgi:hypothetical protein